MDASADSNSIVSNDEGHRMPSDITDDRHELL